MLKYVNTGVVFQEIPDEVTLSINISNCPCHCPDCHSQYLWQNVGEPLTTIILDKLIADYGQDITCMCFMGGDAEPSYVNTLALHLRKNHPLIKVAWYSGRGRIASEIDKANFNYIKLGPYIQHLGCLTSRTTNQRMYKLASGNDLVDITNRFWKS